MLIWQDGHGSQAIWGLPATRAITNWVPLVAFAFLYGLSMDYEVFILTRIREERDRAGSTTAGVTEGIGRTGRLVTSAALILFLALAALSSAPETDVRVMATALGAGILLGATVVRALLVPALVAILGRWSWWLPPRPRACSERPPHSRKASPPRLRLAGRTRNRHQGRNSRRDQDQRMRTWQDLPGTPGPKSDETKGNAMPAAEAIPFPPNPLPHTWVGYMF